MTTPPFPRPRARRRARGLVLALLVPAVALVVWWLPPAPRQTRPAAWPVGAPVVRGAYHVHSDRSDGTGTLDEIAQAAATAHLQFVIVTDHGDGLRPVEPPRYRDGVLMIDAVEISTSGGHLVALGLPQTPYRLAGSPEAVLEDVHRLGGIGIAAHPDSAKPELRWTDTRAAVDGIEWLNADSEWRNELWSALGRGLLTYPLRPAETLAAFLDRPQATLDRWDALGKTRPVIGLAGADAHARLGYRQGVDPYDDRVLARVPWYTSSFRAFRNHVVLDRPFSGEARADAETLLRAIRGGRVYTTLDGLVAAGPFEFTASSDGARAEMGGSLDAADPVRIAVRAATPRGTTLVLLRDGAVARETMEQELVFEAGAAPGVYRVEARLPDAPERRHAPWLVSNPIYVNLGAAHRAAAAARVTTFAAPAVERPLDPARWRAETSAGSASALEVAADARMTWRFAMADGESRSPYAAAQFPVDPGAADFGRVIFRVRADRPMRLWLQLRVPQSGERWGTTFYADGSERDVVLPFSGFTSIGVTASPAPPLDAVDSLLLVADTLNHRPGDRGVVEIAALALVR